MKLLEQYLYAINKKLPWKGREDIIKELRSLILDDLENRYGSQPTEEQLEEFIKEYGSPSSVARQYNSSQVPISGEFTDLYFLIGKLIVLGLTIASFTTFFVSVLTGSIEEGQMLSRILQIPAQILTGSFTGFGVISLIFILITRQHPEINLTPEEEWDLKELKDIVMEAKPESKASHIVSLILIPFALVALPYIPRWIEMASSALITAGVTVHTLNTELFSSYLWAIGVLCIIDMLYHILSLIFGSESKGVSLYSLVSQLISLLFYCALVSNDALYTGHDTLLGIKALFVLAIIASVFELLSRTGRFIKYHVINK